MKYEKLYNVLVQQQQKNDYEVDEEEKIITGIEISAKKYFELDADRLAESFQDDYVLINVDFKNETTEYVWVSEDKNPSNYPYEEDNFNSVCELLEEIYLPKINIWFDSENDWTEYTEQEFNECFNFETQPDFNEIDEIYIRDAGLKADRWCEIYYLNRNREVYNNVFGTYVKQ